MTRRQTDPLRPLTDDEREWLLRVARSQTEPAAHAKALLAVADGESYTDAAKAAGRRSGEAVSRLVSRFNREGLAALEPPHGGGAPILYAEAECERILAEARRNPELEKDGTANWSLATLRRTLQEAPDGLPGVSWQPAGEPKRMPHEYVHRGTAKLLTLFHPATGEVRARGVMRTTNEILHPWLREELADIVEGLPERETVLGPEENLSEWRSWQEGL